MAGFLLPVFSALLDLTGVNSTCSMRMFGTTQVSPVWMHFTFCAGGVPEQIKQWH
ncbi:hypothetical protein [Paraburkholderia caffeinilytica]|uniref:hypothetical protein n=1 Tax=Paraburkholderia caffeinilytica TaxID=1761016 RepID=UPI003DA0E321